MKSKDLQKIVLSKYQNGDNPTRIYRDLNGGIDRTVVPNDPPIWLCQIVKSTRWFTFRKNKGQYSKGKTPFTSKEKSISSKTINGTPVFPREVFGE